MSASAAAVSGSCLLRLRTTAAAAPAAAVNADPPASLRHRRRGCLAGSSRRAAADSRAEILGATLSCRTCPARSTCGAAQARLVRTLRAAAAPVHLARGLTCAAIRRAACALEASTLASCFLLLLRDIATSAGVFRWSTLPLAGIVNHRAGAKARGGFRWNALGRRDQLTCAHVLRLTAARADTSLMPNSAASLVAFLTRQGISVLGSRVLAVKGQTSGQWHTTPVNLLAHDGRLYLVAPRGETQWVRNLRAAGTGELRLGRHAESFRGRELSDDEKVPVLRAYLKRWKAEVGIFFEGTGPDSLMPDSFGRCPMTAPTGLRRSTRCTTTTETASTSAADEGAVAVAAHPAVRRTHGRRHVAGFRLRCRLRRRNRYDHHTESRVVGVHAGTDASITTARRDAS
jgi:deazaflavin-dependent oxidoreductase (nitroreductase family)